MKVSLFPIEKAITSCAGPTVQVIRKAAAGGLLVGTLNDQQGFKLLKVQKIEDIDIQVAPHTREPTRGGSVQEPT